ncbi:MAG: putative CRISPR-associated protein (TIGR02619 family) [Neolewinella sp.]|jgi:putative CRISPR-associated protein (TIGR02619 family)
MKKRSSTFNSKPLLLISTCGISLLTNVLSQKSIDGLDKRALVSLSNEVKSEDIPEPLQSQLAALLDTARQQLQGMDIEKAAEASAEINGLSKVPDALNSQVQHFLISTDTYLGKQTADLVAKWLKTYVSSAEIKTIKSLTTRDSTSFMDGAKNLLLFLTDIVSQYGSSHYVVFNLTGGFKSLLGLMTTLGCFYADEVVYVFESGDDLVRIPKLPIKLDDELFQAHASQLLRMSVDDYIGIEEAGHIPKALLEYVDEQHVGLSVWGELIWKQFSNDLLSERLIQLPCLHYESSFRSDFDNLTKEDKITLQQTLAKAAGRLKQKNGSREALLGHNAGGIKYEQYTGKHARYGHFRYGGKGHRVSCEPASGKLILRHCGEHDYVNNTP